MFSRASKIPVSLFCGIIFLEKINIGKKNTSSQWLTPFKYSSVSYLYKGKETLITFNNLRPVMTLWECVYHRENQKAHQEFQYLFKINQPWPWTGSLRASPCVVVAFWVGQLVLHREYTCAVMYNYGSLYQQIYEKSSLQRICTYERSSYLGHVSNALGKTKEHIKQLLSK